jgi:hypothetical protein
LLTGSVWLARATGLAAAIANVLHKIWRRPGLCFSGRLTVDGIDLFELLR